MDTPRRVSLARHHVAALDAALLRGGEEPIRLLRRLRRAALRNGDIEEAADCLSDLWFLSLQWPNRQLRIARARAREAPSTPSFLDLGHALAICNRTRAARRAYQQAIELSTSGPKRGRRFDKIMAEEARQAIESLARSAPITFVERARNLSASPGSRRVAAYAQSERFIRESPSALAFQKLGVAAELLGRRDEALRAYGKAIEFAGREGNEAVHESLALKVAALQKATGESDPPAGR